VTAAIDAIVERAPEHAAPAARLAIVMPCLNEAETLAQCLESAAAGLRRAGIDGEIIVADNGSTDGSLRIAEEHGARVVQVAAKGYGNALRGGIDATNASWILMADADDSYDFSRIEHFIEQLRAGADLVMGCRLPSGGGSIERGAMPWKNRWLGNPSLSLIGRVFFRTRVRDFHCGMRAFTRAAYERMELKTTGMEFASEMVMKAAVHAMRIAEVPITLRKDGRSRPPHLRPWRDGWRHLRFMLIYSPRWLFLVPGLSLAIFGTIAAVSIYFRLFEFGGINFDVGTFAVACTAVGVGVQLVAFAAFTKLFAIGEGLLPPDRKFATALRYYSLERGLVLGLVLIVIGGALLGWALWIWSQSRFGPLPYAENLRRVIAASTFILLGIQITGISFFMSVLGLKSTTLPPATAQPTPGPR
jgi:glycosyltransferase involved in cell wall biosynthesis